MEDSPEDFQMEIELHADMDAKRRYSENVLVDFLQNLCFSICPIMQEKLSPSLVAPTAVSNTY